MQSQLADIVQKNDPVADASARNPLANFVRDLYQVMDWKIVKPIPGADTGYLYNRLAYHAADHALHLHLESLREFNLVAFGMRDITPGAIGFGPIGHVVFLGSIVFLPLALWWRNKSWRLRFSLLLLAIGFGWIFAFCALLPWESSRLRFFAVPISIFVAAVVPFAYSGRRIAWLWLVPAMGLALWTAGQTALISRDLSDSQASLEDWQVELLQRALPDEAELGTSRGVEFIHYLSHFPAYEFTPVPRIEIPERLRSGELDAALVLEPDSALAPFVLPFERGQSLLVPDPRRVLLANSDLYGVKLHSSGGEWKVSLVNSALVQRLGPDLVRIFLPATGAVTTGGPLHVEIGFPVEPPGKDALSLLCGGKRVTFQIKNSTVEADLPALKLPQNQAYLYCEVRISDHTFGNQVPSSSISVIAESQAHP